MESMAALGRFEVCGVPVTAHTVSSAAAHVVELASAGTAARVHLCNAHVLSLASADRDYRHLLATADLNLPDGAPVAWTAARVGVTGAERVPGTELMLEVLRRGESLRLRHWFHGSTPETIEGLVTAVNRVVPDARVVGAESPPFRDLTPAEFDDLCERLRKARAQVVWVGLGTPKQDRFMLRLRDEVSAVTVAVGAAFDFVAGSQRRAPEWMRRSGLEWAHRLGQEPTRLWRRYLVGNTRYVVAAARTARRLDDAP